MESFGNRLASIRKEHHMTQNDVAEKLHVSPQAVSKWENDITSPDIPTLITLSEIYHMSLDEMTGKKKTEPAYTEEKKDIRSLFLKIFINSAEGDTVKVNLPMVAVEVFLQSDSKILSGNAALEGIDFKQIYELAKQGLTGELISVDSADGDHVRILVE